MYCRTRVNALRISPPSWRFKVIILYFSSSVGIRVHGFIPVRSDIFSRKFLWSATVAYPAPHHNINNVSVTALDGITTAVPVCLERANSIVSKSTNASIWHTLTLAKWFISTIFIEMKIIEYCEIAYGWY